MNWDVGIILIWSGFLFVGTVTAGIVFLWAVRNGQFGDQERARSLPLIGVIPEEESGDHRAGSRHD